MKLPIPFWSKLSPLRQSWSRMRFKLKEIECNPWRPLIVFEVGANDGSSFADLHRFLPWAKIYAFEPTPELVDKIRSKVIRSRNYCLTPKAVGEKPGWTEFNVAGKHDWGCSSLLEFSSGLDRSWPGRTDFVVTKRIKVEVIRLDAFVRERKIPHIDFLHVDTQGTDLSVLRSLGEEICRVRAGVIEVPQNRDVMLYKNQHTREEALEFLFQNGFHVWKTVHNENEDDLYFRLDSAKNR